MKLDGTMRFLLSTALPLIVVIVCQWLSFRLLDHQVFSWQTEHNQKLLLEVDAIVDEMSSALAALNKLGATHCDEDLLVKMRRELFVHPHIRDIGFYEDQQLTCTTGTGVLEKPIPEGTPDFQQKNGYSIFREVDLVLFDYAYTGLIIRKGDFNVVFDISTFEMIVPPVFDWAFVYVSDRQQPIAGDQKLLEKIKVNNQLETDESYMTRSCSQVTDHCLILSGDKDYFISYYKVQLTLVFLLSVALAILANFGVKSWFNQRSSLSGRALRGLKNNAYYPLYQPIVRLEDSKIIGCEVLARFEDDLGALFPDQFIPQIRKYNCSWFFTQNIISSVCQDLSEVELPKEFKININLFPSDIVKGHIRELTSISSSFKERYRFVFEITEDEVFDQVEAKDTIKWIKEQGYLLSVDDFGTGYSNLKHLKGLNSDELKIDRSFVNEMEEGSIKSTLIPRIVEIAKDLELRIVAEGIENPMQHQALKKLGVEYGQGWAFGKPMPLSELIEKIEFQQSGN